MNNLPSIDRVKIGLFLKCAREENGMRNGEWVPRTKMTKSQLALDIFILDLIGRIIDKQFNEVKHD